MTTTTSPLPPSPRLCEELQQIPCDNYDASVPLHGCPVEPRRLVDADGAYNECSRCGARYHDLTPYLTFDAGFLPDEPERAQRRL